MPYLSALMQRRVLDAGGDAIGRLKDLAIAPGERFPVVQWAVVATSSGERVLRWSDLAIEPAHVRLRRRLEGIPAETLPASALRLGRDVLDRRFGSGGAMRVNDLQLEDSAGQLRLLGAEVGARGLLRRIGIEGLAAAVVRVAGRTLAQRIVPWDEVDLAAP